MRQGIDLGAQQGDLGTELRLDRRQGVNAVELCQLQRKPGDDSTFTEKRTSVWKFTSVWAAVSCH